MFAGVVLDVGRGIYPSSVTEVVVGISSSGMVGLSARTMIDIGLESAEWKDLSSSSLSLEERGDRC